MNIQKDQSEIDSLITSFFELFTNEDDLKPQVNKMRDYCIPEITIVNNTTGNTQIYDLGSFISPRLQLLSDGTLVRFRESETTHQTIIHDTIAQRLSHYEKSGVLNDIPFEVKGIKIFQFIKIQEQWLISAIAWCDTI